RESQILGMDLGRPRAVILIGARDFLLAPGEESEDAAAAQARRRSQAIIDSVVNFFHLPSDLICAYIGDGAVAVLKASAPQGVAAFIGVGDEQTKLDLARQLLLPLAGEPELVKTVQIFFAENCMPSQAAARLVIHRNTLTLRLNKIHSLTGLDPRRFDDAMV